MNPINTALIGFGFSGKVFHAPFLSVSPYFNLSKILSSRINEIHSIYPNIEISNNINDIFQDTKIDLIVICSPNALHFEHAKLALENNKHVIVEKPFVLKLSEGYELIELAKRKNRILSVFQNRRWDGDFQTVKEIVDSGVLGQISEFEAHFDRFRPTIDTLNWRTQKVPGSGVLFDLGPHLIDQALNLFGLPVAVFGDIRISRNIGDVDDCFEIILYYQNFRVKLKAGVLVKEPLLPWIIK